MRYLTVAEAYRDLEGMSGRRQLTERLAALLRDTPVDLLPTVAYLCQAQVAPEFAGVKLGMAERSAARALADAAGADAERVREVLRGTGDLGDAAERLLARDDEAPATLEVATVVDTLRAMAAAAGPGSQTARLGLFTGLLRAATPLEARYLVRLVTANLRLGIGTPTLLDALAEVYAGGRAARPVLERAYSVCCDIGLVAATVAEGGPDAVAGLTIRPGNPVLAMSAQRLSDAAEILDKLGGRCAAEHKYDGMRIQAHRTADGRIELFTRRLERVTDQFPDVARMLAEGLRPTTAVLEGEVVAADPATGELRPFQEVMFRRRRHGIADAVRDVPVSLFCFDLLYADGADLTGLPYPQRRERLRAAVAVSPTLRLATVTDVDDVDGLEAAFTEAVAAGCEGLVCKSLAPSSDYRAGARGWQWVKLKRDYRAELGDTLDLVVVGALYGRGRRTGGYGALLLATYDPATDTFPTLCRCGAGFSDADLAALPGMLAPYVRPDRPAQVDARQPADVWFDPVVVIEVLGAELTLSPNHPTGWGRVKQDAGLAVRFPRFTGRFRDDKGPRDATTTEEAVALYRSARRPVRG